MLKHVRVVPAYTETYWTDTRENKREGFFIGKTSDFLHVSSILTGCWVHLLSPIFCLPKFAHIWVITCFRGSPKKPLDLTYVENGARTTHSMHCLTRRSSYEARRTKDKDDHDNDMSTTTHRTTPTTPTTPNHPTTRGTRHTTNKHKDTHTNTHMYMYTHMICVCVCMYVYVYVKMYTYVYVYMYVYVYVYVYMSVFILLTEKRSLEHVPSMMCAVPSPLTFHSS